MRKILLIPAFFSAICVQMHAQDIHFSQFYDSPILLNPAAAGACNGDYRIAVNYRNQWKSVINPYKTAVAAFDTKLMNKGGKKSYPGIGVSIFNDKTGISKLTTNQINVDLAYHIGLNENHRISVGAKTGYFQRYINYSGLKWDSQYNGIDYDASRSTGENLNNNRNNDLDIGAGLHYAYRSTDNALQVNAGGSAMHLTKPEGSFYKGKSSSEMKITAHSNVSLRPKEKNYLILPSALFVMQGAHTEITGGSNIALLNTASKFYSAIHFGAFYRFRDAAVAVVALEYKNCMKFGVSYDVNVSRFRSASRFRGGPEFSFVYNGMRKERKKPEPVAVKDTVVPPPAKPAVSVMSGSVLSEGKPVAALISIEPVNAMNADGNASAPQRHQTDSVSGKYQSELKAGNKYKVKVDAPGYELFEAEIDLSSLNSYTESPMDFNLKKKTPPPPVVQKEEVSPCSGNNFPDLSSIKGKSLRDPQVYAKMLELLSSYCKQDLVFKVQVAAYPVSRESEYNYDHLKDLGTPVMNRYPDGLSRYTLSEFKTIGDAESLRIKAIQRGQKDAWITVFINGKRQTLEEFINK